LGVMPNRHHKFPLKRADVNSKVAFQGDEHAGKAIRPAPSGLYVR
jgi:hypothetical protein